MEKSVWILVVVLAVSCLCEAAKILVVFPLPGKSHDILGRGLVRHLLNAGHEVTYITSFPKNNTNPKLHEIDVSSNLEKMQKNSDFINLKKILDNNSWGSMEQTIVFFIMHDIAKDSMRHENVQKMIKDPNIQFDLVVAEWMFDEIYAGLAAVYNVPLVWFSSLEPHFMILNLIDENTNPAYDGYIVDDSPPFNFRQRLAELWNTIKMTLVRETIMKYLQTSAYNSIFVPILEAKGRVAPSFSEMRYNASLVLGNSHVSMGHATRLPQSYIPIGGYHIEDKVQPLPQDLKTILDNAKDGLIYFSMGSNLKSKDLPDKLKRSLLDVFGTLKQTVLWKFEEKLPNLPKNVRILDWAPQQSILAHPNCRLFITHGGLLSTTETIAAGKPIIGIPVFADQFMNVGRAVAKGFAKRVDLSYSMAEELKIAIQDVLSDPQYQQKVNELSAVFHDRPVKPGVEVVHWVEHIIKTQGAPHMRSPALMVPWYQKLYLDLILIILSIVYALSYLYKKLFRKSSTKKAVNKKKNN